MRRFAFVIVLALTQFAVSAQEKCPVNFNADSLSAAYNNIPKWNGKIIGLEGRVMDIKFSHLGKPYMLVELSKGSTIWAGVLWNKKIDLQLGDRVKLMGYFSAIEPDDYTARSVNKTGAHLLVFALLNTKTNRLTAHEGSAEQVKEWIQGRIPKSKIKIN
jgi:hypothetical protein